MFVGDCVRQYHSGLNNMANLLKMLMKKEAFKMMLSNKESYSL